VKSGLRHEVLRCKTVAVRRQYPYGSAWDEEDSA
jgi:hypothetical protein